MTERSPNFSLNDEVAIVDREGVVLSFEKIIQIDRRFIKTTSKRRWTLNGGWMDERGVGYPFPRIRPAGEFSDAMA